MAYDYTINSKSLDPRIKYDPEKINHPPPIWSKANRLDFPLTKHIKFEDMPKKMQIHNTMLYLFELMCRHDDELSAQKINSFSDFESLYRIIDDNDLLANIHDAKHRKKISEIISSLKHTDAWRDRRPRILTYNKMNLISVYNHILDRPSLIHNLFTSILSVCLYLFKYLLANFIHTVPNDKQVDEDLALLQTIIGPNIDQEHQHLYEAIFINFSIAAANNWLRLSKQKININLYHGSDETDNYPDITSNHNESIYKNNIEEQQRLRGELFALGWLIHFSDVENHNYDLSKLRKYIKRYQKFMLIRNDTAFMDNEPTKDKQFSAMLTCFTQGFTSAIVHSPQIVNCLRSIMDLPPKSIIPEEHLRLQTAWEQTRHLPLKERIYIPPFCKNNHNDIILAFAVDDRSTGAELGPLPKIQSTICSITQDEIAKENSLVAFVVEQEMAAAEKSTIEERESVRIQVAARAAEAARIEEEATVNRNLSIIRGALLLHQGGEEETISHLAPSLDGPPVVFTTRLIGDNRYEINVPYADNAADMIQVVTNSLGRLDLPVRRKTDSRDRA